MVGAVHIVALSIIGGLVWVIVALARRNLEDVVGRLPFNYRGSLSDEARATLVKLPVGFWWWDAGDTIMLDRASAHIFGINVSDVDGDTYTMKYAAWAELVESPAELNRAQAIIAEAVGSLSPYQSVISFRVGDAAFKCLYVGEPYSPGPGSIAIRGILVRLKDGVGTINLDKTAEILGRLQNMRNRLETFVQAEGGLHG